MALVRHLLPPHHGRKRTGATPGRAGRRPDLAGGVGPPPLGRDPGRAPRRISRQLRGAPAGPPERPALAAARSASRAGEGQRRQQRGQPRAGHRPGAEPRPADAGVRGILPARGAGGRTLRRSPGLLRPRQHRCPHRTAQPSAGQSRAAPSAPQHRSLRSFYHYGSDLSCWDHLFGSFTWYPGREPAAVGLHDPTSFPGTGEILAALTHPWRRRPAPDPGPE